MKFHRVAQLSAQESPRLRTLTMFTDASFCAQTKAAGWGAWAKADGWPRGLTFGSEFRRSMSSIHDAELCAIVNALHRLSAEDRLHSVEQVLTQSDSIRALSILHNHADAKIRDHHMVGTPVPLICNIKLSEMEELALDRLMNLMSGTGILLAVRHVPGHSTGSTRQSVNEICDTIARKHMRIAREKTGKKFHTGYKAKKKGKTHA